MRIVFSARPAFGHVFPLVPLARAAQECGHDVTFASGKTFLPKLAGWGFEVDEVGLGIEQGFAEASQAYPELLNPERPEFGGAMFVDVLGRRSLADMTDVVRERRPDLVVYEGTDVGAAVAAAAAGIPVACHALSLWMGPFREALRDRIPGLWEAAGAPERVDVTVGDTYLDLWPGSMQAPDAFSQTNRHQPIRPIPWGDPSSAIPGWLDEVRGPLVFVSLGTVFWGKDLLPKLVDALSALDVDALVLAGADASPEEVPQTDRVRVEGFVDQPAMLRRADAVVHHGGAGTLLGALTNGIPAVVLPEGADRPFTAASLEQSGAALKLDPREASAADIAAAVERILEERTFRENAERIRGEIEAMPSPAEVVEHLESLAS
ncbi:MAG: glycosyltransferase [Actinomycetota bacterium]|nr:glycosyltransferase [Actinomycetota bacterium]